MKIYKSILAAAAAVLTLGFAAGCSEQFEEITELELTRCLQPLDLSARISQGQNVTFSWTVSSDAESYTLSVYSDEEMTVEVFSETVEPSEVPVTKYLDVDQSYWFRVQAHNSAKDDSKWADYGKEIKTYAVKSNLYMSLTDRTSTSFSFAWTADPEVDRIECTEIGSEAEPITYTLTAEDIAAGTATVSGLTPSTEYDAILYFSSANRGEVNAWTQPDMSGLTTVSTSAALEQAITDGANILLTMDGSPYTVGTDKGIDVSKGFQLYGEGATDGSRPVVMGSLSIVDTYDGGDIYCEGIEFNGDSNTYGFLFQHKEGQTTDNVVIGNVTFRNCGVTGYSKGLFYEWSKTMAITSFTFDSCEIYEVNADGSGGGDGFDVRYATSISTLTFTNNTIYNGFRTFIRIDANPVIGDFVFENNTVMNICFVENSNNGGIFGFQVAPKSFSFKKNLFLSMPEYSVMTNSGSKYVSGDNLNITAAQNYFYDMNDSFFNTNFSLSAASGTVLSTDPCYNAKGGLFNILGSSEIAGAQIGASKWWAEYVEEPEDLTMIKLEGSHTWDFTDAKYFSSDFTKSKVRDMLLFGVTDNKILLTDGVLGFSTGATTTKKGVPTDGYLAFLVDQPGSVLIKPADADNTGNHFIIGVGPTSGSSITVKGGAAALADMDNAQKILITDITEESLVYIYPNGAISLEQLAWSTDVTPVNTALPTPEPEASPSTVTSGSPEDVLISWAAVEGAGSYSVVFNGKTYEAETAEDGSGSYTIGSTTVGMLDAGSYKAEVYANPSADDIYNTMSAAGVATFAIQPQGGSEEEGGSFSVSSADELSAALSAKKESIMLLASGSPYSLTEGLIFDYPVTLEGETAETTVEGALTITGTIEGDVTVKNLTFDDSSTAAGCFITIPDGLVMQDLIIEDVALNGYSKSVIYAPVETSSIDNVVFKNISTSNWGTGQGVFDFRKGTVGSLKILESTIVGGRDLIRLDSAVSCGEIIISNNTIDKSNIIGHSNAILYVRNTTATYTVANNLFLNEVADGYSVLLSKASGVAVPNMYNNFYYNVDATNFFTGLITEEIATDHNGVVLTTDPVADSANGDYTLTSALAMSNRVGASKWNPSRDLGCDDCFTVATADEFTAALSAGKTDLKLTACTYAFDTAISAVQDLRLTGEGEVVLTGYVEFSSTDLGTLYFDNIHFTCDGTNGNAFTVSAASSLTSLTIRNCTFDGYTKSVIYDNVGLTATSVVMNNNQVINHGTGQSVFDFRKSVINNLIIEHSTIVGGREVIRADAGTVTGAFTFRNNLVDGGNLGVNANGLMYVRATPSDYQFYNNLFINEVKEGATVILSKSSAVTTPSSADNNFFYNIDTDNFFSGLLTKEVVAGIEISNCPVKDAANGDYTLVDALTMSSNVGPLCWNPKAGVVTTDIEVSSTEELLNAIAAGKTAITMNYAVYDLTSVTDNASVDTGVLTLTETVTLKGVSKAGLKPVIQGGLKFGDGVNGFTAQNLAFEGSSTISNALEAGTTFTEADIVIKGCDFANYTKSAWYNSTTYAGTVNLFSVSGCTVSGFGTGQGVFDIRKGSYTTVVIENSTIYNGGRDFIRADAGIVINSLAIKNNTFASTALGASNGILYVRSTPNSYVVANNLFLNEVVDGGSTLLAKTGCTKADMQNNYFYNCDATNFWTGTYTQEEGIANGGAILDADPCTDSASFDFTVTNSTVKENKIGDPRWR